MEGRGIVNGHDRRRKRGTTRALRRALKQRLHSVCRMQDPAELELVEEELAVVKRKGWRKVPEIPLRVHVRWLLERRRRLLAARSALRP